MNKLIKFNQKTPINLSLNDTFSVGEIPVVSTFFCVVEQSSFKLHMVHVN